ncbi:transposase [Micromonospora sp. DT47]|uniref:transposase n=1 Tax=Micromonospora sp. DT47 TaxID=3393431 RepID=UPI003CF411A4
MACRLSLRHRNRGGATLRPLRSPLMWSASYFAGSVGGAPLTVLRQYIEQQNQPG